MKADIIVLGAGIVGVSAAIHLAMRGRDVALVDRRGPGEETSFGNAGLIQSEGVWPYGFPREPGTILKYALNRSCELHYHLRAMPGLLPFLARFWWHSEPKRIHATARLYAPLIQNALAEHKVLLDAAGAEDLVRKDGWMEVYRSEAARDAAFRDAENLYAEFGVGSRQVDTAELAQAEPFLQQGLAGALHWPDPWSAIDPSRVVKAYAAHFETLGGTFMRGDAMTLTPASAKGGWRVASQNGPLEAESVVIALGPWSGDIARRLGYRFPLAVKRGYHMHYRPKGNAVLNHWTLDAEGGYVLAPMERGIRLTTGIEFAGRDAPKTPVQLGRAEEMATSFFPLGERLDPEPWMGARPCMADMLPVIGRAPHHKSLWLAFGHAHHGFTLGPVTGRLLAEQMTGEATLIDPAPYQPDRFRT